MKCFIWVFNTSLQDIKPSVPHYATKPRHCVTFLLIKKVDFISGLRGRTALIISKFNLTTALARELIVMNTHHLWIFMIFLRFFL